MRHRISICHRHPGRWIGPYPADDIPVHFPQGGGDEDSDSGEEPAVVQIESSGAETAAAATERAPAVICPATAEDALSRLCQVRSCHPLSEDASPGSVR